MGIRNFSLQYFGQPNRLRNCGLKKLRNCDCGPSKFDFRNSATLCRIRPVLLLSSPFLFLWKTKTCLKGTVARDFWPPIFFWIWKSRAYCPFKILLTAKIPGGYKIYNFKLLHAKNLPKIAEVKLSSCGLEVADLRKIAIAELLPSRCGVAITDSKKSCACPPLLIQNFEFTEICKFEIPQPCKRHRWANKKIHGKPLVYAFCLKDLGQYCSSRVGS